MVWRESERERWLTTARWLKQIQLTWGCRFIPLSHLRYTKCLHLDKIREGTRTWPSEHLIRKEKKKFCNLKINEVFSCQQCVKTKTVLPENLQKNKGKLGTWGLIMQPTQQLKGSSRETITCPDGQLYLDPPLQLPTDILEAHASRIGVISVGSGA